MRRARKKKADEPAGERAREEPTPPAAADDQDRIDEAVAASFPASDPPPWTLGVDRLIKRERRRKP